jgi:hypothetical protein
MVAIPGLYAHRAFLMKQEFLTNQDSQESQHALFQAIGNGKCIALAQVFSGIKSMTLRIDRLRKRIRLSGEFRSEHLPQVKAELDQCGSRSVLIWKK